MSRTISNERLQRTQDRHRIVLIGGSSLAFSVSAQMLSERLQVPVRNLGVHAGLGYEALWEEFEGALDPRRDLVVLSPEYGLLNGESTLLPCELTFFKRRVYDLIKRPQCLPTAAVKMPALDLWFRVGKRFPKPSYRRDQFGPSGDVSFHYDLEGRSVQVAEVRRNLPKTQHVDTYIRFVKERIIGQGYRVVYAPTVVPEAACSGLEARLKSIHQQIAGAIADVRDAQGATLCLPSEAFFDSPYHMNRRGVLVRTAQLERTLRRHLTGTLWMPEEGADKRP